MGHFNFESLKNWSTPEEARAKVAKPTPHVDDSHIKEFLMPNPANTKPTRLNDGESYGQGGQLEVKNAAALLKRGIEIAASPVGERQGLIRAALANYGTLEAGPGHDVGDRPAYSRDQEAEVMGADYSADEMDSMKPIDHLGHAGSFIDDMTGCENCDDGKCEECRGNFNKAMAHLSRYAEKTSDGDGDDDSILGESGEKVLKTFDEHSADLERDLASRAVKIASNAAKPGSGHFGGFPPRSKV